MDDPYHLGRFLEAQERNYDAALRELRAGAKRSHWMWYVFPQMRGLGRSETALLYAIETSLCDPHAQPEELEVRFLAHA